MPDARPPLDQSFAATTLANTEAAGGRLRVSNVEGVLYYRKDFVEAAKRAATKENSDAKRSDELKALNLIPFEGLDKAQQYANAGDTMPIVFCRRLNDAGGLWISPPLLDSSSDNFIQTFVFLVSHGQCGLPITKKDYFLGKQCIDDPALGGSLTFNFAYTDDSAVCPISSYAVTCDHTNFNFLADPVGIEFGDYSQIRTVNKYSTGVTIRTKPLGTGTPLERYTLTVYRTDNSTGSSSTVGTINTSNDGSIRSLTDTTSAGNYTYTIENTAVHTASTTKPDTILLEFRQSNTFPTSYDRTTSYTNMQLLVVEGNLFNLLEAYSPPGELKQLHVFVREGLYVKRWRFSTPSISTGSLTSTTGSSNNFADLVYWWFENSGKLLNPGFGFLPASSPATCALFYDHYNITYNAYLTSSTNFLSYAQAVASFMLCGFFTTFGLYFLKPLLPLQDNGQIESGALTPKETFTDSDTNPDSLATSIIAGTYSKQYMSAENALPVSIVVTWRGQDEYNLETAQTTVVRYSDYAADSPEEAYDMSEFGTNADHATIFAKYVLATRRYSRHTVSFQTARNLEAASSLEPLDVIKVSLTRTNSAGDSRVETEYYLVSSIETEQTGISTITATQFPVDGSEASIISNSILSGSFEVTT